ncbi:hypothetical protein HMPREF3191_00850, partial [Veillonellaceae bacterium DNF00626]
MCGKNCETEIITVKKNNIPIQKRSPQKASFLMITMISIKFTFPTNQ